MNTKITQRIKLWGIVQGVGFRPFVAKVADRLGMKGEVLNTGGLVEICVTDTRERIDTFISAIETEKPGPAEIVHIQRKDEELKEFDSFTILKSGEGDDEVAMIPADMAICSDCEKELRDENDRRYRHPFISCMICGPRYTVIDKIPYDRDNTAMVDWPMCDFCSDQYTALENRRYHAQTVSCHDCGPYLILELRDGSRYEREEALKKTAQILKEGGVAAFKATGGYNLMADPLNMSAVKKLREIKNREIKPFAVMFSSVEEIKKYSFVNEVEEKLLESSARPIILLEHRSEKELKTLCKEKDISCLLESRFIGSFLPSMGAQYLLLEETGGPLIATSANISDMPIIKDEDEMRALMSRKEHIDGVLYNERDIRVRVDDSVVRVIDNQPQIIRRSKGYAPVPLYINGSCTKEDMIFASGGQLKNSFALTKGNFAYVSQYFGDLDSAENMKIYEDNVKRMAQLFRIKPSLAVCDMHPLYKTTAFSEKMGIRVHKAQHHHAHIASVMAEHSIDDGVIGVSFDGTGYGTDGNIWGGEILICKGSSFERFSHLKYISMIGGDGSMKEAWKSAACYRYAWEKDNLTPCDGEFVIDLAPIMKYASENTWKADEMSAYRNSVVYKALEQEINTIKSSSMGRLFDSVCALLGIKDYNDYEGQCAILLEDAAARRETEAEKLAYDFHMNIAEEILNQCRLAMKKTGIKKVCLSGGVFQNRIMTEEAIRLLKEDGFQVYYNISVSPNDGGIALGQSYIGMKLIEEEKNGNR